MAVAPDQMCPSDAELVEPGEVERLCGEGVGLVDLREAAAFTAAHLPGAVNIPADALIERPAQTQGAVILYDDDGALIARRCGALRLAVGELEFFVLKGGLNAWRDAGLPLEAR
jgi:rhodanese-related sulfurtransferase